MENKTPSNPRMSHPDGVHASEARREDCFTLRDHFAGQAMQAMITGLWSDEYAKAIDDDVISKRAYEYADAMLKEREKTNVL